MGLTKNQQTKENLCHVQYTTKIFREKDLIDCVQRFFCKFHKGGLDVALFDAQRPGRPSEISDDAKAWMISIACQIPAELGYAQELWTLVSYDEKPGIQAISNTAPDLRPTTEHGEVYRDAEYKRLGTLSLLTGIDLLTGEATPLVSESHKSSGFIEFLKILDRKYPSQDTIRIILDNHSAHTSKETRRFLDTMPKGRFKFVFTPKHGSWLNMIESFFSKMTRQMLRGIRVNTKEELEERI